VRYALQRLLQFLIVFVVVTFLVMVALRMGARDAARDLAGGASATEEQVELVREQYHLDESYPVQFVYWLKNLVTFDLGRSPVLGAEVSTVIAQRAPVTLMLGFYSIAFGLAVALPIAVLSAYRRDGWFDKVGGWLSFGFVSMPNLVLAVLLGFLFATTLGWFPFDSEKIWPWDDPVEHFKNMILPVLSLGLGIAAVFTRLLRADMIATLQSDFITLARAKGLPPSRILWRHALRSSLFSILTSVALQLGAVLGGAVAIETVFSLPGMGDLLVQAVQRNDLLIVQACAALFALTVVFVNFLVDLLYGVVDPRIRHARALG
jgi:peptide/nickel transport system permease protein